MDAGKGICWQKVKDLTGFNELRAVKKLILSRKPNGVSRNRRIKYVLY